MSCQVTQTHKQLTPKSIYTLLTTVYGFTARRYIVL